MSMGDELAGATLNIGEKAVTGAVDLTIKTFDLIEKLLLFLFKLKQEKNKLNNEKAIADMRMKAEFGISSSDMTSIKSGEVSMNKLIRNCKETVNLPIYLKDGVNADDKKFIVDKAKEYGIPVAFRESKGLNYAVLRECDKSTYQQICTELIENKLTHHNKDYHNFVCDKWEMPYISDELNRFGLSAQFGETKDGKTFCLYQASDEQAVGIARGEYLRKHSEVMKDISFEINDEENSEFIIKDANDNSVTFDPSMSRSKLSQDIQKKFNFEKSKADMVCARFGTEMLDDEQRKEFFSNDIQKEFSKIQNHIELNGEDVHTKPYTCLRVKPKTDDISRIVYMDKSGNFAVLYPEKQSNRKMKSILSDELHIKDKATLDALIDKCRKVAYFYDSSENAVNKSLNKEFTKSDFDMSDPETIKNMRRIADDGSIRTKKLPIDSITNSIKRNDRDKFTVRICSNFVETDEDGNEFTTSDRKIKKFSFSDKSAAIMELKDLYIAQGMPLNSANEMATAVVDRAAAQSADKVVEIQQVRADKFFDSDIPMSSTAEMDVTYGDTSATISLSDTEKAKKELMETLGIDEESAEAAIDGGTTSMSFKQESKLKEFGFDTDNLTRRDADYLLDKISKNKWELPNDLSPASYVPFANRSDSKVDTNINLSKSDSVSVGGRGGR